MTCLLGLNYTAAWEVPESTWKRVDSASNPSCLTQMDRIAGYWSLKLGLQGSRWGWEPAYTQAMRARMREGGWVKKTHSTHFLVHCLCCIGPCEYWSLFPSHLRVPPLHQIPSTWELGAVSAWALVKLGACSIGTKGSSPKRDLSTPTCSDQIPGIGARGIGPHPY